MYFLLRKMIADIFGESGDEEGEEFTVRIYFLLLPDYNSVLNYCLRC